MEKGNPKEIHIAVVIAARRNSILKVRYLITIFGFVYR
jgi:hypothetical protein